MNITEMRKRATAVVNAKKAVHDKTVAIKAKQQETRELIADRDELTEELDEALGDMKKVSHTDMLAALDHLERLSDKARALATHLQHLYCAAALGSDIHELARSVLDELTWETATKVVELDDLDDKPKPKKAPLKPPRKVHKPGPWIAWVGGQQPERDGTRVEVRDREGAVWDYLVELIAWHHANAPTDIVAYRVLETYNGEAP